MDDTKTGNIFIENVNRISIEDYLYGSNIVTVPVDLHIDVEMVKIDTGTP